MSGAWRWARRHVTRLTARCDFEYALWQGFFLLVDPKRVYRTVFYHYQTKAKRVFSAFCVHADAFVCEKGTMGS